MGEEQSQGLRLEKHLVTRREQQPGQTDAIRQGPFPTGIPSTDPLRPWTVQRQSRAPSLCADSSLQINPRVLSCERTSESTETQDPKGKQEGIKVEMAKSTKCYTSRGKKSNSTRGSVHKAPSSAHHVRLLFKASGFLTTAAKLYCNQGSYWSNREETSPAEQGLRLG